MIIHHTEPCISCEHYSPDDKDDNHWVCDFDHNTCPHIEALHKAVGYKERIDPEVLDRIRAEIEDLDRYFDNDYFSGNNEPMYKCNEVLQIIDKYKTSPTGAESEG